MTTSSLAGALAVATACLLPATAAAQPAAPPASAPGASLAPPPPGPWEPPPPALRATTAPPPDPERVVSVTLAPIHLLLPVLEGKVELMPTPHLGVALIGGWGSISQTNGFTSIHASVWELGGQVLVYPLEPFDSLVVGIETLWVGLEVEEANVEFESAAGNGLAVGPLVGYKWISDGGFTLGVQGGLYWGAFSAKVDGVKEAESSVGPLLNFDLGWSF